MFIFQQIWTILLLYFFIWTRRIWMTTLELIIAVFCGGPRQSMKTFFELSWPIIFGICNFRKCFSLEILGPNNLPILKLFQEKRKIANKSRTVTNPLLSRNFPFIKIDFGFHKNLYNSPIFLSNPPQTVVDEWM